MCALFALRVSGSYKYFVKVLSVPTALLCRRLCHKNRRSNFRVPHGSLGLDVIPLKTKATTKLLEMWTVNHRHNNIVGKTLIVNPTPWTKKRGV